MDFLTATWKYLPFANYKVPREFLMPFVPQGCQLDRFRESYYISVVGLRFLDTRVLGVPVPGHINFSEINLRFYIKAEVGGKMRHGVSFIKEIVAKPVITWVANNLYNEHYQTMPVRYGLQEHGPEHHINYEWRPKSRWMKFNLSYAPDKKQIMPDTEEQFILERYYGFSQHRGGTTSYEVKHVSWHYHEVLESFVDIDFEETYGKEFGLLNELEPSSIMMAEGSRIGIGRKTRIH